jgi:hypothetical protein
MRYKYRYLLNASDLVLSSDSHSKPCALGEIANWKQMAA